MTAMMQQFLRWPSLEVGDPRLCRGTQLAVDGLDPSDVATINAHDVAQR